MVPAFLGVCRARGLSRGGVAYSNTAYAFAEIDAQETSRSYRNKDALNTVVQTASPPQQ